MGEAMTASFVPCRRPPDATACEGACTESNGAVTHRVQGEGVDPAIPHGRAAGQDPHLCPVGRDPFPLFRVIARIRSVMEGLTAEIDAAAHIGAGCWSGRAILICR